MSQPFVGEIRMFGGNFAPAGWACCDGQLLAISQNDALFALIGTIYGGDGQSTFALPDLRGRLPIHAGSGPGLSPRQLGSRGGAEEVTLTASQIGAHDHGGFNASAGVGVANNPQGLLPGNSPSADLWIEDAPSVSLAAGAVSSSGSGFPHNNLMPSQCVSFIISLFGIFPSRS